MGMFMASSIVSLLVGDASGTLISKEDVYNIMM